MATLWKRGKDTLQNGALLGGLMGAAIVWGNEVLAWIEGIIPESAIVLGEWSIPIYLIAAGIFAGYAVDRW